LTAETTNDDASDLVSGAPSADRPAAGDCILTNGTAIGSTTGDVAEPTASTSMRDSTSPSLLAPFGNIDLQCEAVSVGDWTPHDNSLLDEALSITDCMLDAHSAPEEVSAMVAALPSLPAIATISAISVGTFAGAILRDGRNPVAREFDYQ
jgi:hypothetical protein